MKQNKTPIYKSPEIITEPHEDQKQQQKKILQTNKKRISPVKNSEPQLQKQTINSNNKFRVWLKSGKIDTKFENKNSNGIEKERKRRKKKT